MKNIYLHIFLISFYLLACSKEETQNIDPLLLKSKKLEYTRNTNMERWQTLFREAKSTGDKIHIIHSLSRIKDPALLLLYKTLIQNEKQDTVLSYLIKSVGLIGTAEAEASLLELPYTDYSLNVRRAIITALAYCSSEKSVSFLLRWLVEKELHPQILQSLAIYAKNNFISHKTKQKIINSHPELDRHLSYLLYNGRSYADVPYLAMHIDSTTSALAKKYLLKALYSLYKKKTGFFCRYY